MESIEVHAFPALDAATLYAVLALRSAVFVVEQTCVYLDPDGADPAARHVVARDGAGVVGTARILAGEGGGHRIGRVAVARTHRGVGLGRRLVAAALADVEARDPGAPLALSAQAHLVPFYASFGFVVAGPPHDEDGIPHVEMRRPGRGAGGGVSR